ncbi:MAG: hypothetical protein SVO01_01040, partial [Thermotogota bacterium]|nr:hypothetical protein [Thermotogota bacterium]
MLIVFVFVYFLFQIRKNNFKTKLYVSIFVTSCVFLIFSTTVLNPILNRIDPVFILLKDPLGYFQFSSDPNMIQYNQLFSGRLNLWNTGLSEYSSSSFINKLIGLGPGNFNNLMKKYMNTEAYAHNEFISSIVET